MGPWGLEPLGKAPIRGLFLVLLLPAQSKAQSKALSEGLSEAPSGAPDLVQAPWKEGTWPSLKKNLFFPLDAQEKTLALVPPGWPDPKMDPATSLKLGFPARAPVPKISFSLPLFKLPYPVYLKGSSTLISSLNECMRLWKEKRYGEAEIAYEAIIESTKNAPPGGLDFALPRLMAGLFYMHMAYHHAWAFDPQKVPPFEYGLEFAPGMEPSTALPLESGLALPSETPKGPGSPEPSALGTATPSNLEMTYFINRAATMLLNAIVKLDSKFLLAKADAPVDEKFWLDMVQQGFWVRQFKMKWQPLNFMPAQAVAKEPEEFLFEISLFALWNSFELFRGTWHYNFRAADSLSQILSRLKLSKETLFKLEKRPVFYSNPETYPLRSPIYLYPSHPQDFKSLVHLIQSTAHLQDKNFHGFLLSLQQCVKQAQSSVLGAVCLQSAALNYYQLGNLPLAERYFQLARESSPDFQASFPLSTYFQAQTFFWRGQYQRARELLEWVRDHQGDPHFAPWILTRLWETLQVEPKPQDFKTSDRAEAIDLELDQNFSSHFLGMEARLRRFCREGENWPQRTRSEVASSLQQYLFKMRPSLLPQAKACLLKYDLSMQKKSTSHKWESAASEMQKQLDAIEQFESQSSPAFYTELFEDQKEALELRNLMEAHHKKKCGPLMTLLDTHQDLLKKYLLVTPPAKKGKKQMADWDRGKAFHPYLKWGASEMRTLWHCAALTQDSKALGTIAFFDPLQNLVDPQWRKTAQHVQKMILSGDFQKQASFWNTVKSAYSKEWPKLLQNVTVKPALSVADPHFWPKLGLLKILLHRNFWHHKSPIQLDLVNHLKKTPWEVLEQKRFCYFTMEHWHQFGKNFPKMILHQKPTTFWLHHLTLVEEPPPPGKETRPKLAKGSGRALDHCLESLALKLMEVFLENPDLKVAQEFVIPYLEALSPEESWEDWVVLLQNYENTGLFSSEGYLERLQKILPFVADKETKEVLEYKLKVGMGFNPKGSWPFPSKL